MVENRRELELELVGSSVRLDWSRKWRLRELGVLRTCCHCRAMLERERGRESAGSGRDGRIKRGDRVRGIEVEKGEEWRRDGITLDSSWSF